MDFKKKVILRLFLLFLCMASGITYMLLALCWEIPGEDSVGLIIFSILGLGGFLGLRWYLEDIECCGGLENYEVGRKDERIRMLREKAGNISFWVIIVLEYLDLFTGIVGIGLMVLVYEIALAILKKKY